MAIAAGARLTIADSTAVLKKPNTGDQPSAEQNRAVRAPIILANAGVGPGPHPASYGKLGEGRTMALDHATVFKTPTASDTVLSEVVRRLVETYRPERIYLFGSVARGDAGPDSDYDIMVVVPDDAPPELRRSRAAYVALWGTGVASDVLVWTASQFDSRLHLAASLPATVIREGRLLHAA
jgi:hypothetical protein